MITAGVADGLYDAMRAQTTAIQAERQSTSLPPPRFQVGQAVLISTPRGAYEEGTIQARYRSGTMSSDYYYRIRLNSWWRRDKFVPEHYILEPA